jgi:hypothetical protein
MPPVAVPINTVRQIRIQNLTPTSTAPIVACHVQRGDCFPCRADAVVAAQSSAIFQYRCSESQHCNQSNRTDQESISLHWTKQTLNQVRIMMRDDIVAAFSGVVVIGNSVLRVMSDTYAGLGHLTLRYIDWLSEQFLPDTSEKEWLDRQGDIWLVNADGSVGSKSTTQAH